MEVAAALPEQKQAVVQVFSMFEACERFFRVYMHACVNGSTCVCSMCLRNLAAKTIRGVSMIQCLKVSEL